jgi:hypothetical protein
MLDLPNLKDDIKTEAHNLGFSHLGVALADPTPRYEQIPGVDRGRVIMLT